MAHMTKERLEEKIRIAEEKVARTEKNKSEFWRLINFFFQRILKRTKMRQ